jgi:hypothetical protein
VTDLPPEDAKAAAEVILPLIKRSAPEAIERAELVDQSGLETDEIRAGLSFLVEGGTIREEGGGYALASAAPTAAASNDSEEEGPGEDGPETSDATSPASVPGSGQNYRATFEVTATFAETKDEAALAAAAAMEEEIADMIHAKYTGAVISVDVSRIEAYKPRVIYGEGAQPKD